MRLQIIFCSSGPAPCTQERWARRPLVTDDDDKITDAVARAVTNVLNAGFRELVFYCPEELAAGVLTIEARSHKYPPVEHLIRESLIVTDVANDTLSKAGVTVQLH